MTDFLNSGILTKLITYLKWYKYMHETEKKITGLKALLLKYLCDPVLIYTVIVMTSIMYHYRDTMLTAAYAFASLVIGVLIFRLFDFMMNHRVIGTAAYIGTIYVFIQAAVICAQKGADGYPISFGVWFITPQAVVDFNSWYTISMFLLFMIFMSSVIYYFTRVRYRIFMGFLIFIIPFAIYGKEAEQMPIAFIILMAVGYIMLLVYFRQLKDSDTVVVAAKKETWRSAGIYALLFAAIAAVVPKPQVETDRTFIESLISAEQFTDRLMAMLGNFRDESSGGQYRDVDNNTPLYYVKADEELYLKINTFSDYSFDDKWHAVDNVDYVNENNVTVRVKRYDDAPVEFGQAGELTKAVLAAAVLDEDFAQEYRLSGYSPEDIVIPDENRAEIYSAYSAVEFAPVPQSPKSLVMTNANKSMYKTITGLIQSEYSSKFPKSAVLVYDYYENTFFLNRRNKEIIDIISEADYSQLLWDAKRILKENYRESSENDKVIGQYADVVSREYDEFIDYCRGLLDYGDSIRIYDLAQEITQGLDSDYDKAKAIEQYFLTNDFVYDLKYVKSRGENVENFLFNTKRGVCYEYATAMVLLSRAAGIPARYCEGYLMSQQNENSDIDANYVVTPQEAHGYPELYIEGFGWVTFEPTIVAAEQQEEKMSLSQMLMIAGIVLFIILVLVFAAIKVYSPISHKFFIVRCKNKAPEDAAKAVMYRLCRLYRISGVNTSHQAAEKMTNISGAEISVLAALFDAAVYGDAALDSQNKEIIINTYISAYEAFMEIKKKKKKRRITTT